MSAARAPRGKFLNFNLQHLRESRELHWFILDFIMLALLVINLFLLIVDTLYRPAVVQNWVAAWLPFAVTPLDWLHANFLLVDLVFVSIFLSEFALRWAVAVREKTYRRWFFFPFIHWYDLLGCIPLGSFRILRFLRVFSIIYRLHKYRIIDVRQSAIWRFLSFYYEVLLEELSDRVVSKVISNIQLDLRDGSQMGQQIADRLIAPRLERLRRSARVATREIAMTMQDNPDHPLAHNLRQSIELAMQGNEALQQLSSLPLIGNQLSGRLEEVVADIVVDTVACVIEQSPDFLDPATLSRLVNLEGATRDFDRELLLLIDEVLELVKEQVNQKSWQKEMDARDLAKGAVAP